MDNPGERIAALLEFGRQADDDIRVFHADNMIHRDIKDGNIGIIRNPNAPADLPLVKALALGRTPGQAARAKVKLMDFDTALLSDAQNTDFAGTATMLAPEIVYNPATDLPWVKDGIEVNNYQGSQDDYALGITLLQLLSGTDIREILRYPKLGLLPLLKRFAIRSENDAIYKKEVLGPVETELKFIQKSVNKKLTWAERRDMRYLMEYIRACFTRNPIKRFAQKEAAMSKINRPVTARRTFSDWLEELADKHTNFAKELAAVARRCWGRKTAPTAAP